MEKDIKIVVEPIPLERALDEVYKLGRREAILDMEKQVADAYKAGLAEGDKERYDIGVEDGKVEGVAEGIREVVEWIPELIKKIKDAMWEDGWGVKGVIYEGPLDSLVRRAIKTQLKKWGTDED